MNTTKIKYPGSTIGSIKINSKELQKLATFADFTGYYSYSSRTDNISMLNQIIQDSLDGEKIKSQDETIEISEFLSVLLDQKKVDAICKLPKGDENTLKDEIRNIMGDNVLSRQLGIFCEILQQIDNQKTIKFVNTSELDILDENNKIPEEVKIILDDPKTELKNLVVLNEEQKLLRLYLIEPKTGQIASIMNVSNEPTGYELTIEDFQVNQYLQEKGYIKYSRQPEGLQEVKLADIDKFTLQVATISEEGLPQLVAGRQLFMSQNEDKDKVKEAIKELTKMARQLNEIDTFVIITKEPAMIPGLWIEGENSEIPVKKENGQLILNTKSKESDLYYYQGIESFGRRDEGKIVTTKDIEFVIASTIQNEQNIVRNNNQQKSVLLENVKGTIDFERQDFEKSGKKNIIIVDIEKAEEPVQYAREEKEIMSILGSEKENDRISGIVEENKGKIRIQKKLKAKGVDYD